MTIKPKRKKVYRGKVDARGPNKNQPLRFGALADKVFHPYRYHQGVQQFSV